MEICKECKAPCEPHLPVKGGGFICEKCFKKKKYQYCEGCGESTKTFVSIDEKLWCSVKCARDGGAKGIFTKNSNDELEWRELLEEES